MISLQQIEDIGELKVLRLDTSTSNSPLLRLVERWISDEVAEKKRKHLLELSQKQADAPGPLYQKLADARENADRFYNYWG